MPQHSKEQVINCIRKYIEQQWLTDNVITQAERILSMWCGMLKQSYDGMEEDVNRIVSKMAEYPTIKITYIMDVIRENRPWNFEKV